MENTNGNDSVQNVKSSIYGMLLHCSRDPLQTVNESYPDAQTATDTIQNHPASQTAKDTLSNGPVADTLKDQHAKTTSEFQNLAGSRAQPDQHASTGQPLTHYHSFFYNLLSWQNPRATAMSFAAVILFIFGARYLPALRWSFKVLYLTLGITAAAEIAGKLVLNNGLATSFRPRKYYTIPRESLEAALEDVEQLINFFVIEFQRVLFAENVVHTSASFLAAFLSYWLIKVLPLWGLTLISVCCIYLGPLIYMTNKELIDTHLANAQEVVNSQASQVKDLAGHHSARASSTVKQYAGDYSSKAQEYMGKSRSTSGGIGSKATPVSKPGSASSNYSASDFPHAPKQEPASGVTSHQEQYEKSQFGGQAVEAS